GLSEGQGCGVGTGAGTCQHQQSCEIRLMRQRVLRPRWCNCFCWNLRNFSKSCGPPCGITDPPGRLTADQSFDPVNLCETRLFAPEGCADRVPAPLVLSILC